MSLELMLAAIGFVVKDSFQDRIYVVEVELVRADGRT